MTEPSVPAVPIMSKAKARRLLDRIKTTADGLWALLLEAHDGGAWKALGYSSWAECAEKEFAQSRSNSYRLLNHARLMGELEAAPTTPEVSRRRDRLTPADTDAMGAAGRADLAADAAAAESPEQTESAIDKALRLAAEKSTKEPTATFSTKTKPTANFTAEAITVHLVGEPLTRLVELAVAAGETRDAMATKILRSVLETGEVPTIPTVNGKRLTSLGQATPLVPARAPVRPVNVTQSLRRDVVEPNFKGGGKK